MIDMCGTSQDFKVALRVYVEAKFADNPRDEPIPFSEQVSEHVSYIYDQLLSALESEGKTKEKKSYEEWRILTSDRHEFHSIEKRLKECSGWLTYSEDKKKKTLGVLSTPYTLNGSLIDRLTTSVEQYFKSK